MIAKFFAAIIANVSEQVLMDLVRAIVKEWALNRKKADIHTAVDSLKKVIDETAGEGMSDAEKNARLVDAGRAVADRVRDN